jgi:hypothetical protein
MKSVHELNENELEELKWTYFYDVENDFEYAYEIPNEVIFEHFSHISFVEEDFSCNL